MQLEGFQAAHACEIARVSRAGLYRHYEEHEPRQADVVLRDLIQQIVLDSPLLMCTGRANLKFCTFRRAGGSQRVARANFKVWRCSCIGAELQQSL